jgi:hypothetical protein
MPFPISRHLVMHPLTEFGIKPFLADWNPQFQSHPRRKVDVHIRALLAKLGWDGSRSLTTTIRGMGASWRCQRISRRLRRRSPAPDEEYFMPSSRIFHVERL